MATLTTHHSPLTTVPLLGPAPYTQHSPPYPYTPRPSSLNSALITTIPLYPQVLFRPVTVMVPDMRMIMENMLMAEGYQEASGLAKKFFTLYALLIDLLSPQLHYDWGLRAIKSVLVQATLTLTLTLALALTLTTHPHP